ncbi:MAG: polysaccharide biosynthesis tyrosine autokinase [Pigmentiphaga sp.]|uniref:polysaccharide biosynthesis tyrosine autokinase n=1 Tax=Pigmentiphaga sp. TaxID=1977564 RepID=UPI0029A581E4|nr:polysaccharide biosynthesis tyrosine autokinase [Pigmentiphaga sp.]MDX3906782.1 polysaccharide biosynthesis tyrosine autokinase [Pigmentiphaga sp.]
MVEQHSVPELNAQSEVSLAEILDTILQHIKLIAAIFVTAIAVGGLYATLATPIYRADALIQVENRAGTTLTGLSQLAEVMGAAQSPVAGELEVIQSREVLMNAARETRADLDVSVANRFPVFGDWYARRYEKQPGQALAPAPFGLTGFAWGGESLKLADFSVPELEWGKAYSLELLDANHYLLKNNADEVILKGEVGRAISFNIQGNLAKIAVAEAIGRPGTVFEIVQQSPVQVYNKLRQTVTVMEASRGSSVISIAYEDADPVFAKAVVDSIARSYLQQNVGRRSEEARTSLQFLERQLPELKRNVEASENALNDFRTKTNTVSMPRETDLLLQRATELEGSRMQLQLKRQEMLQSFRPEHPTVKAVDSQMAQINEQLKSLARDVDKLPAAQRDLLRLERDVQVNTQLYISLLNNAQELRIAEAGTIGNVRIIDFAVRAESPISPRKAVIVAVAAFAGLALGVLAVLAARILRPTVHRADQVEKATGLATYVTVPESYSQRKFTSRRLRAPNGEGMGALLAFGQPDDPAVESLRSLRTGLAFAMMGSEGKVIVITGATAGVGKSFVSANLAALLVANDKRILIVDADMRRPRLGEYFSYGKAAPGLSDVLVGRIGVVDAIQTKYSGLDVLSAGQIPPNPGELLISPAMSKMLETLEARYDYIVLDTPPLLPVADTLALLKHAAAAFLVVRAEQSTISEVKDALKKLDGAGVRDVVKGVIFNGVKRARVGYGSSYKYYYSYGTGK